VEEPPWIASNMKKKDEDVESFYSQFGDSRKEDSIPLIYSPNYNISFAGLEKLHPFDSCKYKNIMKLLLKNTIIKENSVIEPTAMPDEDTLKVIHTKEYLESLKCSSTVAQITEIFVVSAFPNFLVRSRILNPMLYATSGSILAGKVAMERGWAINLGGGYHHCSGTQGGGFCVYADITLSIKMLRQNYSHIRKVMIIDLDVHQGNGHERDKITTKDREMYIFDMYNRWIYPCDENAKQAINMQVELQNGTQDEEYLKKLRGAMAKAFDEFTPHVIYYNAGTDILKGDPLGCLEITPEGVKERDEMVFKAARIRNIPIVMLLSGGYQRSNAEVISNSIANLDKTFGLFGPKAEDTMIVQNR